MNQEACMENLSVLVKETKSCPLNCVYCYEGKKSDDKMSESTLKKMIDLICSRANAKRTSFIWHGAEPLTMGIDFFRTAKKFQKPYTDQQTIGNSIQSCGVGFDQVWLDFLLEEKITISFSLDGPEFIHSQTRPHKSGKSSFQDTMRAIQLLQNNDLPAGVIAVITNLSIPYIEQIYEFFKQHKIHFKINPVFNYGNANNDFKRIGITKIQYAQVSEQLFDLWFNDPDITETNLDTMFSKAIALFNGFNESCNLCENCVQNFISVDTEGNVLPCSRFTKDMVCYGNINDISDFSQIVKNPIRKQLLQRPKNIPECQDCKFRCICHSGCMHSAMLNGDILQKDPNCYVIKRVYTHIQNVILDQLKKDQAILYPKD